MISDAAAIRLDAPFAPLDVHILQTVWQKIWSAPHFDRTPVEASSDHEGGAMGDFPRKSDGRWTFAVEFMRKLVRRILTGAKTLAEPSRVVHTAVLWKSGEAPRLKTSVLEGDAGLPIGWADGRSRRRRRDADASASVADRPFMVATPPLHGDMEFGYRWLIRQ